MIQGRSTNIETINDITPDIDSDGVLGERDVFGGAVYVNTDTATGDTARRFETTAKKLRDVVIQVQTNAQLFGTSASQVYRVEPGEAIGFTKVDISTLYFKNATAGQNGTVNILAVEE